MTATLTSAPPALEQLVSEQMREWSVPGVVVGILHDGQIETWGFGVTSIETEQPVTGDTLFQIGSITKVFTATLIMQLVDEGRLDLDAPVRSVLPSFRLEDDAATESVTPRHLLTHTTGFFGDRFDDFGPGDDALNRAMAAFHTLRQYTPPGDVWAYCNTGFQALGAVIELRTEMSVEQAIRERVLAPLGLDRSFFFAHEAITYRVGVGHNRLPGKDLEVARPYPLIRAMNAAGGIIGTVGDLLRFAAFHMSDGVVAGTSVLSSDSIKAMQTIQTEAGLADFWGLGWSLNRVDGRLVVGHGGSTNGFRANLSLVPGSGTALAVLTNGNGGRALNRVLETWFLEAHAGLSQDAPVPHPLSPESLGRFAGHYRGPTSETDVSVVDGGLQVDMVTTSPLTKVEVTLPPQRMTPVGESRFVLADGESVGERVDFIGDGETPAFMRFHGRLLDRVT
ncbi:MAG: serine hydrolase domain-containing protein [Dehalococcoidia bacterium]